jgi:hypothetical protein
MSKILVLVALLVALPLVSRIVMWFVAHVFGRAIGEHALSQQPDRITMTSAGVNAWKHPATSVTLARALEQNDFESAGVYTVAEMPGLAVQLLAHRAESWLAAVYEHPKAGNWVDIATRFADGTSCTFSSLPPTGLDPRPGHPVVNLPGAAPATLLVRARAERKRGVMVTVTPETASKLFADAYADSIAWRKTRGVGTHEVVKVAEKRRAA